MYRMARGKFGEWLDSQYLKWQAANGRRTLDEFAEYLGVGSRVTLSRWINGQHKPDKESIDILAAKLGPEVYDLLGLQRPDPQVSKIVAWFTSLPEEARKKAEELMQQLAEGKQAVESEKLPPTIAEIVGQLLKMPEEDVEEYAEILRSKADRRKRTLKNAKASPHR